MKTNIKKIILSTILFGSFVVPGNISLAEVNQSYVKSKITSVPSLVISGINNKNTIKEIQKSTANQNNILGTKIETKEKKISTPIPNNDTLPTILFTTVTPSTTSAILNGTVNPNGSNTQAWFRTPASGVLGFQNLGNSTSPVNMHQYVLIGLTPDTEYQFRIGASNISGTTEGSWRIFRTLSISNNKIPPTIISATATSSTTSAILNGTINPNGLETEAWFEKFSIGTPVKLQLQKIGNGTSPVALIPHNLTGLTPDTEYKFRIVASNESGITIGNWITFRTLIAVSKIPTLNSISPSSGEQGENLDIDLTGTGFVSSNIDDLEVIFSGSGIDINSITVNSATSIQINIDINSNATVGERTVMIKNSVGTSNSKTFTVIESNNGGGGGSGGGGSGSYIKRYALVTTQNATNLSKNSATLNGLINPNNANTTVWFEYGTSSNLSTYNETSHLAFGSFNYYSTLSQGIGNLNPNTTYYFRAVGNNSRGTVRGAILSFTTEKNILPIIPDNKKIVDSNTIVEDTEINNNEQIDNYDFLNNRNLAATPIFGFTDFLPSSTLGWLILLIIILLIALIGRKLYREYQNQKAFKEINADHVENLPI